MIHREFPRSIFVAEMYAGRKEQRTINEDWQSIKTKSVAYGRFTACERAAAILFRNLYSMFRISKSLFGTFFYICPSKCTHL